MDPHTFCAKAGWPARTYIQQLCEDTGCCPEDLPRAMNDREEWRERVRDIRATSATWWWWNVIKTCLNLAASGGTAKVCMTKNNQLILLTMSNDISTLKHLYIIVTLVFIYIYIYIFHTCEHLITKITTIIKI